MKKFKKLKLEFTSPVTPQKNGVIVRGFATFYSKVRAMMTHTGLHKNLNTGLWPECATTANKLENILVNPKKE